MRQKRLVCCFYYYIQLVGKNYRKFRNMCISQISSYGSNSQALEGNKTRVSPALHSQGFNYGNQPAQPAFEGGILKGFFTFIAAVGISIGAHAQSTAAQVTKKIPESINPKFLQFNPKIPLARICNHKCSKPWYRLVFQS